MKVKVNRKEVAGASEVHVVDEPLELSLTPDYCYAKAADELRSKNYPTTIYGNSGMGSSILYVPDHTAAKLWIELGRAIQKLDDYQ